MIFTMPPFQMLRSPDGSLAAAVTRDGRALHGGAHAEMGGRLQGYTGQRILSTYSGNYYFKKLKDLRIFIVSERSPSSRPHLLSLIS